MKVHQVELAKHRDRSIITMVVWVDATLGVKKGNRVTGKDKEQWLVVEVYPTSVETTEIHDDWKVGGLC